MDLDSFCHELPKIELHAHLNGSLSRSTMLELQRHLADSGVKDKSNAFLDEFQIGSGDTRNLSDCFQVFSIAHALTSTPETLALATSLTLKEFEDDGCCYIELRSTPRDTPYMNSKNYVETIIETLKNTNSTLIPCLIISINRNNPPQEAEGIANIAIEYHKKFPDLVVGIELSGNPAVGKFQDFMPALTKARQAGLKVTLHCGEICNPQEVMAMLKFKPDRIGHGVCIHQRYGGNDATWETLCKLRTPVEVCLTSNVNTKSTPDYNSHHFKELYDANIPIILCTDDKGVFATSLSQEYRICAETFGIEPSKLARLSLSACDYIFAEDKSKTLKDKMLNFINKNNLNTNSTLIPCLIISINRNNPPQEAEGIANIAIEYHKKFPDLVVGIELSGNPAVGKFQDFMPALTKARQAGLKVTLHCGEICNPQEVMAMLKFKPDRIGHGVCIHQRYGGNDATWETLCKLRTPVEVCLTSNVNTKSTPDYNSHHFKELYDANIPIILCTDDKGVFATSLSQEYRICAETFGIEPSKLARLSLSACDYIFAEDKSKTLKDKMLNFINKNNL